MFLVGSAAASARTLERRPRSQPCVASFPASRCLRSGATIAPRVRIRTGAICSVHGSRHRQRRRTGGSPDPPRRRGCANSMRIVGAQRTTPVDRAAPGDDPRGCARSSWSGGDRFRRWPCSRPTSLAERHRTDVTWATPAGGAIDTATALGWRGRGPSVSRPGARWLRASASSVTRGMCARRSSTGAGCSRERGDETEHTPATTEARRLPHAPDARPPTTRDAIDVTPRRGDCRMSRCPTPTHRPQSACPPSTHQPPAIDVTPPPHDTAKRQMPRTQNPSASRNSAPFAARFDGRATYVSASRTASVRSRSRNSGLKSTR